MPRLHLFFLCPFPKMCSQCEITQKETHFNLHTRSANEEDLLWWVFQSWLWTHTAINHTHTCSHLHTRSSGRWPLQLWHPTISEQMFRGWMRCFVPVSSENGCWSSQERLGLGVPTSHQAYRVHQKNRVRVKSVSSQAFIAGGNMSFWHKATCAAAEPGRHGPKCHGAKSIHLV